VPGTMELRRHCITMGIVIQIGDRLESVRKRRLLEDVRRAELRIAHGLLMGTEREVQRQMLVLSDKQSTKDEVEEALEIVPLLVKILLERRRKYERIELDLIANTTSSSHNDYVS
jgi:hypothetical protein